MNYDNLHELINRYEAHFDELNGPEHDELFKWRAMKVWRDEWFKPENTFASFAERFTAAKKEFSLFIDNSRMHPSNGVLKLWEKEPEQMESLFKSVLFAEHGNNIATIQSNMDTFLDDYEALRIKYFPGNWSFKQDRHSASVYLAMNEPDVNYVYKANEAQKMARYIDFDQIIGSGKHFSLENYYRMCNEIVSALTEHKSLLNKHFGRISEKHYEDRSLHLMAFDLIYCCRTYGYYTGLVPSSIGKTKVKKAYSGPSQEELERIEAERIAQIEALEEEISQIESTMEDCEDISLIGVQVSFPQYGQGVVTEQDVNKITVRFESVEKSFVLDEKYAMRPRFENDEEIVNAFTKLGRAQERIKALQKQIDSLQR